MSVYELSEKCKLLPMVISHSCSSCKSVFRPSYSECRTFSPTADKDCLL